MTAADGRWPWYSSLYWRIGVSFVVFLVVVILTQRLMFTYAIARGGVGDTGSPVQSLFVFAAGLGAALAEQPALELTQYIRENGPAVVPPFVVVLADGRAAASPARAIDPTTREVAATMLQGRVPVDRGWAARTPLVAAPIVTRGRLAGLVVVPPPIPSLIVRDVGRMLSIKGSLLLVLATIAAAAIVFAPARRRLRALEEAAVRLGSGDTTARAPHTGADEIARVARAFNQMADDLAERRSALERADRQRRQMFADVSHELKTPLTSIRGYLETLRMPGVLLDQTARDHHLDTVGRETRRLERLVADLLDLAKFENNVAPLDVRLFAIQRVFDHVTRRYAREASARDIGLAGRVTDGADQIAADPDRIEQVIDNLVANALRHTPAGGWVTMDAVICGDKAVLSVSDTGDGIAPEHLPHVFDRFYKGDAARATSPGSGLGLSIARAIVERHGGAIHVASGAGRTVFWMELPQSGAGAANL